MQSRLFLNLFPVACVAGVFLLAYALIAPGAAACSRAGYDWTVMRGLVSVRVLCTDATGRMFLPPKN